MRTIFFTSLFLAAFLFAKPFIVFPETVDYDFTKSRSQISRSDYKHLICEFLPPDVDNSEHSFVAIGVQKHISGNKCSAELLYIIRDSTEQFHAGDKFITNCGKNYSTGLQFFSGREIRYRNNYERSNIFLIELNYNLTEYIYYPGSYGDTWSDFMMPAHFPIGHIACPETWRRPIDFIKEGLIDDLFELSNKIYIYGPPLSNSEARYQKGFPPYQS